MRDAVGVCAVANAANPAASWESSADIRSYANIIEIRDPIHEEGARPCDAPATAATNLLVILRCSHDEILAGDRNRRSSDSSLLQRRASFHCQRRDRALAPPRG